MGGELELGFSCGVNVGVWSLFILGNWGLGFWVWGILRFQGFGCILGYSENDEFWVIFGNW